jgi:hypothetical protein
VIESFAPSSARAQAAEKPVPPLTFTATVSGPDAGAWVDELRRCVPLIRALGSHRHRGLGRCRGTLAADPPSAAHGSNASLSAAAAAAGCVWLDIELLSDVIVSLSAATSGGHEFAFFRLHNR